MPSRDVAQLGFWNLRFEPVKNSGGTPVQQFGIDQKWLARGRIISYV
jgi:hypothetical protein